MEFRASGRLMVRSATRPSRSSKMSPATPVVTVRSLPRAMPVRAAVRSYRGLPSMMVGAGLGRHPADALPRQKGDPSVSELTHAEFGF
jgi:hypothetical protein